MSAFRNWYVRNQDIITWFIVGFLTANFVSSVVDQQWIWATVIAVIIYANVKLAGVRLR